jgi:hypothetical protein
MFYQFSSLKMGVARGYPKPFAHVLEHCMPHVEALVMEEPSMRTGTNAGSTINLSGIVLCIATMSATLLNYLALSISD